jgi:hypothetical protein
MIGFHLSNLWRMLWTTAGGEWVPLAGCMILAAAVACAARWRR